VALAPLDQLARIDMTPSKPGEPPLSVVFTDWLWIAPDHRPITPDHPGRRAGEAAGRFAQGHGWTGGD